MCDLTYLLCFDEPNWNLSCSSSPLLLLGRVWSLQTLLDWPWMSFPSSFLSLASPDRILVNRWWWFPTVVALVFDSVASSHVCCCHLLSVLHLNCHCVHASFCSGWFWWSLRPLRCLLFCFCPVALLCFILWCCRPVSFLMLDFRLVLLREPWRRKWCWCCCWMCWCLLCDGNLLFLWWCCFFFHGLLILDCIADVSSSSSCVVMPLSAVCFGVDVALGKMKMGGL